MSYLFKPNKILMSFILRFYLFFCWFTAIFLLLMMPMRQMSGPDNNYYDKVIHAFLFGVLAYLFVRVFVLIKKMPLPVIIFLSLLISALYSAGCEYLQQFIPGRTDSLNDFLAGLAGIIIAMCITYEKYRKRPA